RSRVRLGKYVLKSRLGEGGYGEVWKAWDSVEGINVALKIPYRQFTDSESLQVFREEARIQAKLDHPRILRIKSAEFIDDHFVIATDLGRSTLAHLMERALPLKKAIFYFEQALAAVAHAHTNKIVHRDIKPDNFIVFGKETLRLGDFGIAQILAQKKHSTTIS